MKLLAIDTATEQCSAAVRMDGHCIARCVPTPRGHTELILPMVEEVLAEAGITLQQLDAIAFGRGPGAFTGVRIAIGVAQGLAYACGLPLVPVSNLAAVAQQRASAGGDILVCMDARMNEVYWGVLRPDIDGLVTAVTAERVAPPDQVIIEPSVLRAALGTGFRAYPVLQDCFRGASLDENALPRAVEIAVLAERDFANGLGVDAAAAQPVYLRDQVTHVKTA